jgi:hypothetical protein
MNCQSTILASDEAVTVGPAVRGTSAQSLTVVINDAFGSAALTHVGDWAVPFDGFDRNVTAVDSVHKTFHPNGNVIGVNRIEACTLSGSIAVEIFGSFMMYDVMNQRVVLADQGADGTLWSSLSDTSTLFTLTGFDSRGNATNFIDPKQGTWFGKPGTQPAHLEQGPVFQCQVKTLVGCYCICGAAPSSAGLTW